MKPWTKRLFFNIITFILIFNNMAQAKVSSNKEVVSATVISVPLYGNPKFNPDELSPQMRVWYNRLWESIADRKSYIEYNAKSGSLYRMRVVNEYVSALMMALRATGDLKFLDEAAAIMDMARALLKDEWRLPDNAMPGADKCNGSTDGFLDWLQLEFYPKSGYNVNYPYFCTDEDPMDEAMTHGGVAAITYAFYLNKHLNPKYQQQADFWLNYLQNHFMGKWAVRKGSLSEAWSGIEKRFTHPISNLARIAYYLYKMTGKEIYLQKANYYTDMLVKHVQTNTAKPQAFVWKHNVWGNDEGYQKINYAEYFMTMVMEMSLEKFGDYYPDKDMEKYAATFRDVVFAVGAPNYTSMAARVDGSGTDGMEIYNLSGFARWDKSGTILQIADKTYMPGAFMNAAYALMALSPR
ncbi:MAG: hypothetical protein HZA78_09545 [Candidatus Schekmanbacteria bacterium]|nr:hypothetical protein [Candidatus Schekmanbacteria bacterium]